MVRTKEELQALYDKFDRDVASYSRIMRSLLAIDQLFNVIVWNGSQDETISSHIGRKIVAGKANWFEIRLCKFLHRFEDNHCRKSLGE